MLGSVGGEACTPDVASTSSDLLPRRGVGALSDDTAVEKSGDAIQRFRTSEEITAWFMPRSGVVKPQYTCPLQVIQVVRTLTDTTTRV